MSYPNLTLVLRLNEEVERLKKHSAVREEVLRLYEAGIREHRDARGDDRCWRDDVALYQLLPEGFCAPELDSSVELERCKKFIACRQNPATEYVSPQRRIEALIAVVRAYGSHAVDCDPNRCSCGALLALQAAGLVEAEIWK